MITHYLFDERVGIEGQYGCYNLNCGILLETQDGYYIVGEMNETTSYPKGLQILKSLDNLKCPYLEDLIALDCKSREDLER